MAAVCEQKLPVVVAVDFDVGSELAFATAIGLECGGGHIVSGGASVQQGAIRSEQCELHVVHVLPPTSSYAVDSLFATKDSYRHLDNNRKAHAEKVLGRMVAQAKKMGLSALPVILTGDAGRELCHYCRQVSAHMLVVGCTCKSVLKRTLLGSVSSYCLHHSPCTVLLARPKQVPAVAAASSDVKAKHSTARTATAHSAVTVPTASPAYGP